MVGRDDIAAGAGARLLRVKSRLDIDQLIEPCDVLLRRHSPDARWRRSWLEGDAFGQWPEK